MEKNIKLNSGFQSQQTERYSDLEIKINQNNQKPVGDHQINGEFPIDNINNHQFKRINYKLFRKSSQGKPIYNSTITPSQMNSRNEKALKIEQQDDIHNATSRPEHKAILKNKARFFIAKSPQKEEQILTMNEIIDKLNLKDDIKNNKTLHYQLKSLQETLPSSPPATNIKNNNHRNLIQKKQFKILPFPFLESDSELKKNQEAEDKKFAFVDDCLRNLEELELSVSLENGGNIDKFNPVANQYKAICNSLYNLCQEEGVFTILNKALKDKQKSLQMKKLNNFGNHFSKLKLSSNIKGSVAKSILVSSLLKSIKKDSKYSKQSILSTDNIEISYLKEKVSELKQILISENHPTQKYQKVNFIDQAEIEINKLLMVARKKQKEREKALEIQNALNNNEINTSDPNQVLSLQVLLKMQKSQRELARRFKISKEKYESSLTKIGQELEEKDFGCGKTYIAEFLKTLKQTEKSEFENFENNTKAFLTYLVDTYGAYFISQKTYCMSSFVEYAPLKILKYFENCSSLLTTFAIRFNILSEKLDDYEFAQFQELEFNPYRNDLVYRFISQSLRYQGNFDILGLDKAEWKLDLIQKFNMLSIFNFLFREAISFLASPNNSNQQPPFQSQTTDKQQDQNSFQYMNTQTIKNQKRTHQIFTSESLKLLREQFAKLKFEKTMNFVLVDKFLQNKIPFFAQFNQELRYRMYEILSFKQMKDPSTLHKEDLDASKLIVILSGSVLVEVKATDTSQWQIFQELSSGSVLLFSYLTEMQQSYHEVQIKFIPHCLEFDFMEFDSKMLSQLVFGDIQETILRKMELIQSVDIFNSKLSEVKNIDPVSPYITFILAILCKVQVYKYQEILIRQEQSPKVMYIVLEGLAKVVYEELLEKKNQINKFSRKAIKRDGKKSINFLNCEEVVKGKEKEHFLKYKHQMVFQILQEGGYLSSRAILDEAGIKNFIKANQTVIRDWLERPLMLKRTTYMNSIRFMGNDQPRNLSSTGRDNFQRKFSLSSCSSLTDEDEEMFRQETDEQLKSFSSQRNKGKFSQLSANSVFSYEKIDEHEYIYLKGFLLRSQLSVISASSQLKVMVITKQDKNYFCETVKKQIDERISEKNFIDVDRPMKKRKELESAKEKEKQWISFRESYEEFCMKNSFFEKFDK